MMNDLISLAEAAKMLPKRQGRTVHLLTVKRWIVRGVSGVRLAAEKIGGIWYTTARWIEEFCRCCTLNAVQAPNRHPAIKRDARKKAKSELQRRYGFDGEGSQKAEVLDVR